MQVVLSLLLNILLLGASVTWWSGGLTLSASGSAGAGRGSGILLRGSASGARGPAAWEACERAQLDVQKLDDWGCKVFDRVCFDQVGADR